MTATCDLHALVSQLTTSTWSLAAIGTLFDSGLADALREPRTLDELAARVDALPRDRIARVLDAVAVRGIVIAENETYVLSPGAMMFAQQPMTRGFVGDIRSTLAQSHAYMDASRGAPMRGWHFSDPKVLQAQGDASAMFAGALKNQLIGKLGDLAERFAGGEARMLDIGVGVGALSIAICRAFPTVRVVGLDVFDIPLALARDNVARAELSDRIELRQLAIQDLREESAYDLVWLPACFLAPSTIDAAIARARAALRPGGFLLLPSLNSDAAELERATFSMVLEHWGAATDSAGLLAQLRAGGFATPMKLGGPGWMALIAAAR